MKIPFIVQRVIRRLVIRDQNIVRAVLQPSTSGYASSDKSDPNTSKNNDDTNFPEAAICGTKYTVI